MTAALFFAATSPLGAHKTVVSPFMFTPDVKPILQARCLSCHRPGAAAIPLDTYQAAKSFPFGLQQALLAGITTPSLADDVRARPEHGGLSMIEFDTLMTWSAGGTPEAGVPPPHKSHVADHGGMLIPVDGDAIHLEVVWQEQRRVRLHATDAHGTPLPADRLQALQARVITDADRAESRFAVAAGGAYLEARIASQPLPATMRVFYSAPGAAEQEFGLLFHSLAVPPPDFAVAPLVIPAQRRDVLALVDEQARVAEQMAEGGDFSSLYVPTAHLRELLLALGADPSAAARQPHLARVMRAVWLVHLSGDLGTPPQARAGAIELRRAADALLRAW
jgi:hypothetical protein